MRKIVQLIMMLSMMIISSTSFAGLHDYPTVAVLTFANHVPATTMTGEPGAKFTLQDTRSASDKIYEGLLDIGKFNVLEREQLISIINEQELGLSGLTNETRARVGQLLGAQYILYGAVTGCSLKVDGFGLSDYNSGVSLGGRKYEVNASIAARLIEVETGRVVLAASGKGRSTSSSSRIGFSDKYRWNTQTIKFGAIGVSGVQVENAFEKAVDDLVYGDRGILAKMEGRTNPKIKRR